ncbi:tetratricopeptide repeat protein, partial [Myxococcota bacterium]|nr:tetratricopeptide repeat protein [Myxococcota bacterium]
PVDFSKMTASDLHLRGKALFNKGFIQKAISAFEAAMAKDPGDFRILNMLSIAHKNLEQNTKAIAYATKAITLDHNNRSYGLNTRGLLYRKIERYDLALADYNEVLGLRPNWSTGFNNRALVYIAMGRVDLAIADYKKAFALNPKLRSYSYNLSTLYFSMGDMEKAYAYIKKSLALNPDNLNSNLALARFKQWEKHYDDAEAVLTRMFEIYGLNDELAFTKITLHSIKGEVQGIRDQVAALKKIPSPSRYPLKYLALGHYLLGQYSQGFAAALRSMGLKKGNNKTRLYALVRSLPLLLKLNRLSDFRKLAAPLVSRQEPQWIDTVTLFLMGELTGDALKKSSISLEREFEGTYYRGLRHLMEGDPARALPLLQRVVEKPLLEKVEWIYAHTLLADLKKK